MGCSQSNGSQSEIEDDESLRRCRDRKLRMEDAVSSLNAFAAARSAYAIALKNTGAATSSFAHGEAADSPSSLTPPSPPLPPPPPLPVQRAGGGSKKGTMVPVAARTASFLQVMNELDGCFLMMYERMDEVSKTLEATRMHYSSSYSANKGHIPSPDDGNDDFNLGDSETHATILEKMLASENKLYEEVKAVELIEIEYQRKAALLNKQKIQGVSLEEQDKAELAVTHLRTRYIADTQSMDSTVSDINHLRDDRLYPKLVELVDGMAKTWEMMYMHHTGHLKAAAHLKNLDMLVATKETSEQHHEQTIQLWDALRDWHSQFEKLMKHQKEYIGALVNWLKLDLIPIESSLKENVSSPPRAYHPPIHIHILLHAWQDQIEKLPDALAGRAISSFSEVVHMIVIQQEEELEHRAKCEKMHREIDEWQEKHVHKPMKKAASSTVKSKVLAERAKGTEPVPGEEQRVTKESVKARLDREVEDHQRMCKQVREKSLASLKTQLPELFLAMSDFAHATSEMYKSLRSLSHNPDD